MGLNRLVVPLRPIVSTIRLPGPAHARLGLEVEERLDPRRVEEVDAPARRDDEAVALEQQVAALDLGAAEEQRPIVGALQPQVRARHHAGDVVLDPQAGRRDDPDVEAHRRRRRGRAGRERGPGDRPPG